MKTKNQLRNRILSLVLALVMVTGLLPMTAFAATPSEAKEMGIPFTPRDYITYSNGAVAYYKNNNYLYKAEFSNLTNLVTSVSIVKNGSTASSTMALDFKRTDATTSMQVGLCVSPRGNSITLNQLPTQAGNSVSLYAAVAQSKYYDINNSLVKITCIAVNEPTWSWNGTTSASARFISTDGSAAMTLDATIESVEQTAASCLEKGKVTYTATATANGKTYTDTKTVDGAVGPHSYTYSSLGNTITETCNNCSNHTATATLEADGVYIYSGSAITPATITYSDNWQGDKPTDISYVNNVDVGTATATITVEGHTLTKNFQIKNAYSVSFNANGGTGEKGSETIMDGEEYTLPANPFTAPNGYQFKGWATSQNGNVLILILN